MSGLLAQACSESVTSRFLTVSWYRFPASTVAGPQGLQPLSLGMDNLSYEVGKGLSSLALTVRQHRQGSKVSTLYRLIATRRDHSLKFEYLLLPAKYQHAQPFMQHSA